MSSAASSAAAPSLPVPAGTRVGAVRLTVRDLERAREFYAHVLGLEMVDLPDGGLAGRVPAGPTLVELYGDAFAAPRNRRATGLYHLAILLPTRRDLALALARVIRSGWPLDGASDHLVSEALYLSDPEGNGIELYRDRPRAEWPRHEGQLQMATLPLDLQNLLEVLSPGDQIPALVPAETTIGHVHLQVSDLDAAEGFYHDILGFDVVVRLPPSASFVSAGGYHHHIGMNTWHSAGSAPPPSGSAGLREFDILLPEGDALDRVLARARAAGLVVRAAGEEGFQVRDPSGNAAVLRRA